MVIDKSDIRPRPPHVAISLACLNLLFFLVESESNTGVLGTYAASDINSPANFVITAQNLFVRFRLYPVLVVMNPPAFAVRCFDLPVVSVNLGIG